MLRGPLYRDGYPPQLSGHETFPIRYGWLKKAYDAVRDTEGEAGQQIRLHRTGGHCPISALAKTWSHQSGIGLNVVRHSR